MALGISPISAAPISADRDQAASGTNTPVTVTFSGVGTASLLIKGVGLNRSFTGVGTVTKQRAIGAGRSYTGIGTASLELLVTKGNFASSGVGSSDLTLGVGKGLGSGGTGTADEITGVGLVRTFGGVGSVALGIVVTPAGGTNFPVSRSFSGIGTVTLLTQYNQGALPKLADPASAFREPFDISYFRQKYARQQQIRSQRMQFREVQDPDSFEPAPDPALELEAERLERLARINAQRRAQVDRDIAVMEAYLEDIAAWRARYDRAVRELEMADAMQAEVEFVLAQARRRQMIERSNVAAIEAALLILL